MTKSRTFVFFLHSFALGAVLFAQERVSITPRSRPAPVIVRPLANLRLDVEMVQIPVSVTDVLGHPLIQLTKGDFRLFEDDVELPIKAFSVVDAPISAVLVFDSSRSMKPRIAEARAAVEQFLKTSMPGDEFALVRFSDKAEVTAPFTQDVGEISRQLSFVEPHGWTALYDAACLAAHQMKKASNNRRVLVIFSDGADNNSRYSESELIAILRESDVRVYAASIFEKPRSLEHIAEDSGGRALWVKKLDDLPAAVETLSRQIRSEYMLGYTPASAQNDGKYHRVRVEVQPPSGMSRVVASWKHGYTAPGE